MTPRFLQAGRRFSTRLGMRAPRGIWKGSWVLKGIGVLTPESAAVGINPSVAVGRGVMVGAAVGGMDSAVWVCLSR